MVLHALTAFIALALAPIETEVSFKGAGGLEMKGTLTLPSKDAKGVPAVLLLPGSGPTDRNGNQPGLVTDVHKQLAFALAEAGLASFRFDKRATVAYASSFPKEPAELNRFFSYENFITDVRSAYQTLRAIPEVDSKKVGIFGHSEGGLFAIEVAAAYEGTEHDVAFLGLLASPGRTIGDVMKDQVRDLLKVQGASASVSKSYMDKLEAAINQVIQKGTLPDDVPPGLAPLLPSYATDLLKGYFTRDASQIALKYEGPVFIVNGERDHNISPSKDAKRLEAAFKKTKTKDVKLLLVPNVSHNLKHVKSDNDPGFSGPVVPEIVEALKAWLKKVTGS